MQKVTVKEVTPPTAKNKPTVIVTSDGSRMSGFQSDLKSVKPGAVLEVEIEVKGNYNNIKEFKEISPGSASPGNNEVYREDPAKRASIEAETATKNVMNSYTQLLIAGVSIPEKLEKLWDKSLDWCDAKIQLPVKQTKPPAPGPKAGTKPTAEQDWAALGNLDFDPRDLASMISDAKFKDVTVKTYCISQYKEDANGQPLDKTLEITDFVASLKREDREKLFKYLQERSS